MTEGFKPGDLVRLKSGGPVMSVKTAKTGFDGYVDCQWFSGKKLESGRFNTETLVAAPDPEAETPKAK